MNQVTKVMNQVTKVKNQTIATVIHVFTWFRPIRSSAQCSEITRDMKTVKRKNFAKTTAVRRDSLVIVIRFELSPGGKGCGLLFKRTGVRLPYYRLQGKKMLLNLLSMIVSARTRARFPRRRKERELVRLRGARRENWSVSAVSLSCGT